MKNFKKEYRDLETSVLSELRNKVETSKLKSKFCNHKAVELNVFDYVELSLINDRLTFLDRNGYHYSIFTDANLEDLIDILNKK